MRKETTSIEVCLVTCLKWSGEHRVAQIPTGDGKGFHNLTQEGMFPIHGYEARAEFITGSYDWLR